MTDKKEDKIADNNETIELPNDWIKPPLRLRRGYNIAMLIFNILATFVALIIIPLGAGLLWLNAPKSFLEWLQTYAGGLVLVGAGIAGCFYFFFIYDETRKGIKRHLDLIRKNIR